MTVGLCRGASHYREAEIEVLEKAASLGSTGEEYEEMALMPMNGSLTCLPRRGIEAKAFLRTRRYTVSTDPLVATTGDPALKPRPPVPYEQIYSIWDELADYDAAQIEAARVRLMESLCRLACAQDATWIGAVRMENAQPGDPIRGWRPRVFHYLRDPATRARVNKARIDALESHQVDETILGNVSQAGRFRVNRLVDLVSDGWFDGAYYRTYYLGLGFHDAIWAGIPINEDAESYFGLYRAVGTARFSEDDCAVVGHALRGLKWFHRQQMLAEGLHVASEPLTALERRVLQGLLQGQTDKEIARLLGQSPYTTGEYVRRILRKYGVGSRTALMALWLGRDPLTLGD